MIQINRETFQMMLHQIMERFDRIDDRLNRMNRQTAALEGDKLLDNQDMCELLGVTKRTLARYRQKKLVTYYMIDGRTYYKASEVQDFLSRKGKVLPAKIKKEHMERMIDAIRTAPRPAFHSDYFLTDEELSKLLKVSRRTLQEYRTLGVIPYYLVQGKALYKESDIQKVLDDAYKRCREEQRWV